MAAATLVLFAVYIGRSEPRLAVTWTLWEKFEVSPVASEPATEVRHGWTRLSEHATSAECSGALRKIVKDDERAGSRAVFDEKAGTMAITVYVEKEGGQIPHDSAKAAPGETPPKTPGVTDTEGQPSALVDGAPADRPNAGRKRVRNLECRATQRLESDSLFQRALRRVGLSA